MKKVLIGCYNGSWTYKQLTNFTMYVTHLDAEFRFGTKTATSSTRFLFVSLFAKNIGNVTQTIDYSMFKLKDNADNTYSPVMDDLKEMDLQAFENTQISPNVEKFGVVFFEVPNSVSVEKDNETLPGYKLVYENDDEKAVFDLSERKGTLLSDNYEKNTSMNENDYLQSIRDVLGNYSKILVSLPEISSSLTYSSNNKILDSARKLADTSVDGLNSLAQQLQKLNPPEKYKSLHNDIIESVVHAQSAANYLQEATLSPDEDLIQKAAKEIENSISYQESINAVIQSEHNNNTPKSEFDVKDLLDNKFLESISVGQINGLQVGIGTTRKDVEDILGKPDNAKSNKMFRFLGYDEVLVYGEASYFVKDGTVTGIEIPVNNKLTFQQFEDIFKEPYPDSGYYNDIPMYRFDVGDKYELYLVHMDDDNNVDYMTLYTK